MKEKGRFKQFAAAGFCMFVCILLLRTPVSAKTANIKCGEHATAVLDDLGTLTIDGSGDMYDQARMAEPNGSDHIFQDIYTDVYRIVIGDKITRVGNKSFTDFPNVQSISIGKGVTAIGEWAFMNLENAMFTSIDIPSGVQTIEDRAFEGCTNVTELSFQTGLKKIGKSAFAGCRSLKRVSLPDGINAVEEKAFSYCNQDMQVTVPQNIAIIKEEAFYNKAASGAITATVYSPNVVLGSDCFWSSNTRIKCYRNSTAEKYAAQYSYASSTYLGVESNLIFDAAGGTCKTASMRVTSEYYYANLPSAARAGYRFLGWFTEKKGGTQIKEGDFITQAADRTVYAHWKKISVKKAAFKSLTNKKGKKLAVNVKKVSGANGYEVQYGTKKNMKGAKIKRKNSTAISVGKLKKGKTYFVRVRAYQTDGTGARVYGKWSAKKQIKIQI